MGLKQTANPLLCLVGESDLQLNPYLFIAYLLIDVIIYSNGIDNPIYKMETDDRHGEQTCRRQGGCGGGSGMDGSWGLVDTKL